MFDMQDVKRLLDQDLLNNNFFNYKEAIHPGVLYDKGITGKDLTCAVIDTGCDYNHPLLKDKIIGGRNFTFEGDSSDFMDLNGHGTHVAGLIAADSLNNFPGGIAPDSKLLICKVLTKNGSGGIAGIIQAIDYAINNNVDVINLSLGGLNDIMDLRQAIMRAYAADIIICCASGNNAKGDNGLIDEFCYPGAYQEVIEVGAINKALQPCFFSNSNNMIDCVCYGEQILSTYIDNSFALLDGTSQATPLVAGSVLLLEQWFRQEFNRIPSKEEIYAMLIKCSTTIEGFNRKQTGFGYIQLNKLN